MSSVCSCSTVACLRTETYASSSVSTHELPAQPPPMGMGGCRDGSGFCKRNLGTFQNCTRKQWGVRFGGHPPFCFMDSECQVLWFGAEKLKFRPKIGRLHEDRVTTIDSLSTAAVLDKQNEKHKASMKAVIRGSAPQKPEDYTSQEPAMMVEHRWKKFFEDPSMWWDNRKNKSNPKGADLRFATTGEGLSIDNLPDQLQANLNSLQDAYSDPTSAHYVNYATGSGGNSMRTSRLPKLSKVKEIHSNMMESGSEFHLSDTNTLMAMYVRCGSMVDARHVLDNMPMRDVVSWNVMILGYSKWEESGQALELYVQMYEEGFQPTDQTFIGALRACSSQAVMEQRNQVVGRYIKVGCLEMGRAIHCHVVKSGCESNAFVGTSLVDMYVKCGSMKDARHAFDTLPHCDVASWNAMISGYVEGEESEMALELYMKMQQEGIVPDCRTFVYTLKACSSLADIEEGTKIDGSKLVKIGCLEIGRAFHSEAVKCGFESNVFVGTTMVHMYIKCGSMDDAWHVFDMLPHRTVVSWNAIILGYAEKEEGEMAFKLYARMQQEGVIQDHRTFVSTLKACSSLAALEEGKQVDGKLLRMGCLGKGRALHSQVLKSGFESDVFVGTNLVHMYTKCGSMDDALHVFDEMPCRGVVSWNAMILGYADKEEGELALALYARMQQERVIPAHRTFVGALKSCSSLAGIEESAQVNGKLLKLKCLEKGRAIHSQVVERGLELNAFVRTSLVDLYTKCGSMEDAWHVFNDFPHRDVVSWNAMILGYAEKEEGHVALELYARMQEEGVIPDHITFVGALKACSVLAALKEAKHVSVDLVKSGCLEMGRDIHSQVMNTGFESDVYVGNTLVHMYAECGSMKDARHVFDKLPHRDVVSWNTLILGYAEKDESEVALQLCVQMQLEAVIPEYRTFIGALKACGNLAVLQEGKQVGRNLAKAESLETARVIHSEVVKKSFELEAFVGTALVNVYTKCGSMEDACHIFEMVPSRSVVLWNAMIGGYAEQDQSKEAFTLYAQMQEQGLSPDSATFLSILKASANTAALETGKEIHDKICRVGCEIDETVASSLIDMYGKCGSMVDAQRLFDALPTKDVVTWNALIAGYARQGETAFVFHLFERLRQEGIEPNGVTFVSVLTACNHSGLVDKGRKYFQTMSEHCGIVPTMEHYNCMVDLLGRAGHVEEAFGIMKKMPFQANLVAWLSLLSACQKWKNVEVGKYAFKYALSLDEKHPAAYVLMSNIYAHARMWEECDKIQVMRNNLQA